MIIFPMVCDFTIEDFVAQDVDTFSHSFLSSCDQDGLFTFLDGASVIVQRVIHLLKECALASLIKMTKFI